MAALVAAWRESGLLTWQNMARLVGLNLLWLLAAWPIVTLGPATLAAYWWIARSARDDVDGIGWREFFAALARFLVPGLLWSLLWVVVLALAYSNVGVWTRLLPPLAGAVVEVLWVYVLVLLLAAQPFLLESLTVRGDSFVVALRRALWAVAANPLYAHAQVLVPAVAVALGFRFRTLLVVVLVAVVLLFQAVAAARAPHQLPPESAS